MIQLGLIGFPLGHSLSPKIHAATLKVCGLEGDYSLLSIAPDDVHGLKQLLDKIRMGEIQGLNVTIPHKQTILPFLDELTPTAQAIGAVNTIYFRDGKLIGENTDALGFITDLKRAFHLSSFISQPSALVFGAGGSARAVVYALLNDGWQVTLAARRIAQAQQLANSFSNYEVRVIQFDPFIFHLSSFILLVNATPLGMTPNVDISPLPDDFSFPPRSAIYDLVYNPRETKLVRQARTQGLSAVTGLGMLIEQAALSFEIWTGRNPSRDALFQSVDADQ